MSDIGVGSMVVVTSAGPDGWEGEPSGIVVGTAGSAGFHPGIRRTTTWLVVFDQPAYRKDGRGPYERAAISSRELMPAPEVDDPS